MESLILYGIPVILAYLTGAIPTSIWVGRAFYGIDIREHGSGNAGASNTMRILGARAAIPVLLFDIFKGWLAVKYGTIFHSFPSGSQNLESFGILLGLLAVIGHIFPVYEGFRGGKGVATVFGVLLAIHPTATLCAGGVFILAVAITRIISVGSMSAGISFPFWIIMVFNSDNPWLNGFSLAVAVLLLVTHRENIGRLWRGEEKKAGFLVRNKEGKS
jgi:glycerol-3-phosphate acyltransferase PlsY